jgi:phospholipase/carboxylesterase
MLEMTVLGAEGASDGVAVIVLMHGRGAAPSDLAPLRSGLPAGAVLVLPRALHPGRPWGYGPGWAWYRYEGGTRPEPASFEASQAELEELLDGLPDVLGFRPGPVVLGGFSQGGTMALGYALRHPEHAAGVLVFSGFLPEHPEVEVTPETVRTPVWWGHGTADPAVRHTWAVEGRAALRSAGAELEARDYPIGHAISPEELADAAGWLDRQFRRAGG